MKSITSYCRDMKSISYYSATGQVIVYQVTNKKIYKNLCLCIVLYCIWHPIKYFMPNRWGNNGNNERIYFGGSKTTADGDCNHEIKRHLLLGRKAMTSLDSTLKSTDITLPTKVHLVKAMFFPVVMYICKSWTIKKVEYWRIDPFEIIRDYYQQLYANKMDNLE